MAEPQSRSLPESLRPAMIMALVVGSVYAAFMTARLVLAGNPATGTALLVFGLNFAYCAVPAFLALWLVFGLLRRL